MAVIQAIDATTLRAVVGELRQLLLPSRFEKAQQSDPHTVQIALRGLEACHWLELGWQAEAPRLFAIAPPLRQGDGSTLAQQLQHGLRGLALVALEQQGWERVVELGFARRPGEPIQRWLVLELMGRHSNLFLLDEQRRVIAAGRQVRSAQSRLRPIGTGDPYGPPPALAGDPPRCSEAFSDWQRRLRVLPLALGRALPDTYQGISPSLARQLTDGLEIAGLEIAGLEIAGLEPVGSLRDRPAGDGPTSLLELPVAALRSHHWQALFQRWQAWLAAVEAGCFCFQLGGGSDYRCWQPGGAATPSSPPPPQPATAAPINRALAAYYGERLGGRRLEQRRAALRQRLEAALAREKREQERQQTLLEATADSGALQGQADALLCLGNPSREEIAAAQKLYHQARRLRRAVASIEPRLNLHRQRRAWLEASLHFLVLSDGLPSLGDLEAELDEQLTPRQGDRRRRRAAPTPQPLELRSPAGLRLQVGRNHRQNDWISLRQARRGDLWFHAQECPGSHVVLKASEADPGPSDRQAAADLAAHFSRARGNGRVPVVMVATEQLQRIAAAGPGTVRHEGGEILWGEPDRALALLNPAPPPAPPGSRRSR